ncbi:hypothetical protein BJ165DRAFT_1343530 [Panaeolus papilionaceus]|nr:hypothetical protein BJ165DRAFT_1343530 [Panaeolus papilionaceus]
MILKTYLTQNNPRPAWTRVLDRLLSNAATNQSRLEDPKTRVNPFIQTWKVNVSTKSNKLPKRLKRLITTAKKYNLTLNLTLISQEMKEDMPIWHHPGVKQDQRLPNQKGKIADCLRNTHKVYTVKEANELAKTQWPAEHQSLTKCKCDQCQNYNQTGCRHPNYCVKLANQWTSALTEKWNPDSTNPQYLENPPIYAPPGTVENTTNGKKPGPTYYNPNILANKIEEEYHIFGDRNSSPSDAPATRLERTAQDPRETIKVEIVSECLNANEQNISLRTAIWIQNEEHEDEVVKIENGYLNHQSGELIGIYTVAKRFKMQDIEIKTITNQITTLLTD